MILRRTPVNILKTCIFIAIAILLTSPTIASTTNRYLEEVANDNNITGWAWNPAKPTDNLKVYFYADGDIDTGEFIGTTIANQPGDPQNHRVKFAIPEKYKDNKVHLFYGYTQAEPGKFIPILGSPVMYPTHITSAFYDAPNYPTSNGWAADNTNYFQSWSCSSSTQIDTIRRLNIAPLTSHHPSFWKDSLWINSLDNTNGFPDVYFTASVKLRKPKFSLKKAIYNKQLDRWIISNVMNMTSTSLTGVSSQDGTKDDYVLNEYQIAGWGPTANKPGLQSKIPGVANTTNPPGTTFPRTGKTYPLIGTGPLGITTISNLDQKRDEPMAYPHISSYHICRHANPTLFDYDANSVPQSLMVSMAIDLAGNQPCKLPPEAPISTLEAANYVYRYKGTELGWQLDLDLGPLPGMSNNNYKWGSKGKFLMHEARGDKIIQELDITTSPVKTKTILNCSASTELINMGEIAGDWEKIIFLGDAGNDGNLTKGVGSHDIYIAYNSDTYTPGSATKSKSSDFNTDGKTDAKDYTILKTNFGTKYNIFDYNLLVSNYNTAK